VTTTHGLVTLHLSSTATAASRCTSSPHGESFLALANHRFRGHGLYILDEPDGHHHALHDGKLTITGKAPAISVRWAHHTGRSNAPVGKTPVGKTPVGTPHAADAIQALVQLRFPKPVARDAVAAAIERLGTSPTLEQLIREALRSAGQ